MNETEAKLWATMMASGCQDCKYFNGEETFLRGHCALGPLPLLKTLDMREYPRYEWEDRLTREDFVDCE